MKGYKTMLIGLLMAIIPAVTQYAGAIDWNAIIPAPWGLMVGGAIMMFLRYFTDTAVFKAG